MFCWFVVFHYLETRIKLGPFRDLSPGFTMAFCGFEVLVRVGWTGGFFCSFWFCFIWFK